MQLLNTALVLGPYDWEPAVIPTTEFAARLRAVRQALTASGATGLLVYGDTFDHGALSYITGFTPKLGPAFALVPREGDLSVLFSGGGIILDLCQPRMSWVEQTRSLGSDVRANLTTALQKTFPGGGQILGLWETGAMTEELHSVLRSAAAPLGRLVELQEPLERLRRHKSPCEQGLLRRAGEILTGTVTRLRKEVAGGTGARSAAVAAECEAYARGAQDARVYTSIRNGGSPLPFDTAADPMPEPLLASVAVRYAGYWAAGHVTLNSRSPLLQRAETALREVIDNTRPGISTEALLEVADRALAPYRRNPARRLVSGIGLSLAEGPDGSRKDMVLDEGDACVFALETADGDPPESRAQVSAMLIVRGTGAELL